MEGRDATQQHNRRLLRGRFLQSRPGATKYKHRRARAGRRESEPSNGPCQHTKRGDQHEGSKRVPVHADRLHNASSSTSNKTNNGDRLAKIGQHGLVRKATEASHETHPCNAMPRSTNNLGTCSRSDALLPCTTEERASCHIIRSRDNLRMKSRSPRGDANESTSMPLTFSLAPSLQHTYTHLRIRTNITANDGHDSLHVNPAVLTSGGVRGTLCVRKNPHRPAEPTARYPRTK